MGKTSGMRQVVMRLRRMAACLLAAGVLPGALAQDPAPAAQGSGPPLPTTVPLLWDARQILLPPAASPEVGEGKSAVPRPNLFESQKAPAGDQALRLDVGGNLPLPGIDDPALGSSKYRDSGFHLGLDYHLAPQWEVSGLAGVKTGGGPVATPDKPSVDQVGVEARFKF